MELGRDLVVSVATPPHGKGQWYPLGGGLSQAGLPLSLCFLIHLSRGQSSYLYDTFFFCLPIGIHYVGSMQEDGICRLVLDQITEGQLDWAALSSPFDIMVLEGPNGRKEFPMYSGEKAYIQGLKEKFPQEEAAIDKYVKLVKVTWP